LVRESALGSYHYLEFISAYVDYKVRTAYAADPTADPNALRSQIIDANWNGYLRDFLYANRIYTLLDAASDNSAGELYSRVKPSMTTASLVKLLDDVFAEHAALAAGKPAPAFTATDLEGNALQLSTYKGKVVYLDIWATWCGPCLREIPAMETLIGDMDGQDVVFLAISVDENEAAWRKMLKDKAMKGIHGIAPGNFESSVAKAFQVKGIPRYVLIDQDGNIANANAPRPGEVKEELERLLKM
jgi:thiol-disulfide isomerase/thioredoxin